MKVETVAQCFATYRAGVIPPGAPDVQVEECRRAFYAAAYFMLMNLAYNIGDDSVSEEDGIAQLEQLKAECETFAATVGIPLPIAADEHYTTPDAQTMKPLLQKLGGIIGEGLPRGWGFNLLLFEFGPGGSLFYISNAQREDIFNVMREFIRRNTQ